MQHEVKETRADNLNAVLHIHAGIARVQPPTTPHNTQPQTLRGPSRCAGTLIFNTTAAATTT
jgi:hypothetical protein